MYIYRRYESWDPSQYESRGVIGTVSHDESRVSHTVVSHLSGGENTSHGSESKNETGDES